MKIQNVDILAYRSERESNSRSDTEIKECRWRAVQRDEAERGPMLVY